MAIPTVKEIWELVKAGATIEAQEKVMELRQAVMDLQETNIDLREELQSLKAELQATKAVLDNTPLLPRCPRCGKRSWSLKESKEDTLMGEVGMFRRLYECGECGLSENRLEEGGDSE